jgi:hypothetical protein
MIKKSMAVVMGLSLMILSGCDIKTPEIHGVVLDAETKQPVPDAWIQFTIGVKTKNISGGSGIILRVEPPHTRTDKDGKFFIPSKKFDPSIFPGFSPEIDRYGLIAETIDDRIGGIGSDLRNYVVGKPVREYETKYGFLYPLFSKFDVTILIRKKEYLNDYEEYFKYLQGLYGYCFYGRVTIEVPPVQGGCDDWELNYVIVKHDRFLEMLNDPKTIEEQSYYRGTLKDLAYLYKKQKKYRKSLEMFNRAKDFDEKRDIPWSVLDYKKQIK